MRVLSYLAYDLDSGLLLVLENSKAPEPQNCHLWNGVLVLSP